MISNYKEQVNKYRNSHQKRKRWKKIIVAMASVTVFCTTYALILPAITMERITYCGLDEHPEHTEECYSETKNLICTLPEETHIHNENCITEVTEYVCGLTEEGHVHTEDCKNEDGEYICGMSEEGHVHSDDCKKKSVEYICGLTESAEPHPHNESCYEQTEELTCQKPIHTHTLQCYSNPNADIENSTIWEQTLRETTGCYADDVLAIAQSQLGYAESQNNYLVMADGITQNGYTRYGEWYGNPYGDWNCMFTSFCVHYAGIPGNVIPISDNVSDWISYIGSNEHYIAGISQGIAIGDIAFLDSDYDGIPEISAVVSSVSVDNISVIQGDVDGAVATTSYELCQVTGYIGLSAERTDDNEILSDETEVSNEGETFDVTILHAIASDSSEVLISGNIPADAEVVIEPVVISEIELDRYFGADGEKAIKHYAAYDITIYVDGVEWQPNETVSVTISNPAIQIDGKDNFEVAHIDSLGKVENINAEVLFNGDVLFNTDGFSLYIIYTYTVDFHYSDLKYSLIGGEHILLSELVDALGIELEIEKVVDVQFSDDTLIRIDRLNYDDGATDWRLVSLNPFSTEETLVITLDNNEKIIIHVTDAPGGGGTSTYGPLHPMDAPDYIGPYPTGNGSTQWQITKQEYTGRSQANKIPVDSDGDGKTDVWLQKNVVPTNTENEFLIYLSIDKKVTWEEFLNNSVIGLSTTGKYKRVGEVIPGGIQEGNITQEIVSHGDQGGYTRRYYIKFNVYQNHNSPTPLYVYYDWRYGNTSNCSNATVLLRVPGLGDIVVGAQMNLHFENNGTGNPLELNLYLDTPPFDFNFYDTVFNSVTDVLGDKMEFIDFIAYDSVESPAYDPNTHTITWFPSDNQTVVPDIDNTPITGWSENVAQLVYRVRLNVEDENFISCADTISDKQATIAIGESFKTNNSAVLNFDKIALPNTIGTPDQHGLTAIFPIPEVRGLLYDLTFIKLNEEGRQLADAIFALYQVDGVTPVFDSSGNPMTLKTLTNSVSRFENLPYGTYVLKEEQAPTHYTTPAQNAWTVRLSYTDAQALLYPDEAPYEHNMRYTGNDTAGQWRITNPRIPFHYSIEIIKVDEFGDPLADAGFSIVDPEHLGQNISGQTLSDGKYLFEAPFNPNIAYELFEIIPPEGYFCLSHSIQFRVDEDTNNDTYTAVFLNKGDFADTVSLNLREIASSNDTKYVLEITVQNQEMYELPSAGGTGTLIYTFGGITFLSAALMYCFVLRRIRGRRLTI